MQAAQVLVPCKLDGSELREMRGHELRIEKCKSSVDQARHEMDERNLAGIPPPGKHAFAEKSGAELHAIQAAHQLAVSPAFDGMRMTFCMQLCVDALDIIIDPGFFARWRRRGALPDHLLEGGVHRHPKAVAANGAGKPPWNVKLVEGKDGPVLRRQPHNGIVVAAGRHRKNPRCVGTEQQLRRERRFPKL
ncbi:MAG TPA: hypothetical protein VLC74_00600 [Rhizomicrobium sp.]|nr:hypothetical protein [Rhizomicrobium sp.]